MGPAWSPPAPAPEPLEAEPAPELAEVVQLPGTAPAPTSSRRPERDQRREVHPEPGSPDRFSMLPEHVIRDRTLPVGARVLYAELQRQVAAASLAMRSLDLCTVATAQLAANLGANRDSVRRWLADLERAHLIEYRPEDDRRRGLRVRLLWIAPRRG